MYGEEKDRCGKIRRGNVREKHDRKQIQEEKNSGQKEQSRRQSRRKEIGKINSLVFAAGTGNTCLFCFLQPFFVCFS